MKKHGGESFDVPMRFHDGIKICQLVGTFILIKIDYIIHEQNNAGPYRDDDSDIFRNLS